MPSDRPGPIRLLTLGRLDLRGPDGNRLDSVLQQTKRLGLLAYIAASPDGFVRRDHLLALFWPELDEEHARNSLNQAVHRLRRSVGEDALVGRGPDELSVDRDRIWCDAAAFEAELGRARYAEALDLYGGDFLEGLVVEGAAPELEHWMDRERVRLRKSAVAAAWELSGSEQAAGNLAGAVRWASRAVELDPADETAVTRLVEMLDAVADRPGALRACEEYTRRMKAEYDLEPSPEFLARVEAIRRAGSAPVVAAPAVAVPAHPQETRGPTPGKVAGSSLMVLPFRMLRPDQETDFLAFSLPDAITSSLAGIRSLTVRSNLAALRFAGDSSDLDAIAARAGVDVVLTGTILRAGDRIRVSCQLTDAADGRLIWSQTSQLSLCDVFELQDQLTRRIVDSLSIPLTAGEQRSLDRDLPASPAAYELYLRANHLAYVAQRWSAAQELYRESVTIDPGYAPAWARLARCERFIAKYAGRDEDPGEHFVEAERGFQRALELNPDLSIAHNLYAQLEVDLGRASDAMVRLLFRASGGSGDPEIFAGLVHACRFCGLLNASRAAHEQGRRLDPGIVTSVAHTYWMMGDYARALESAGGDFGYVASLALASLGQEREAILALQWREREADPVRIRAFLASLRAALEGNRDDAVAALELAAPNAAHGDPEGHFYIARTYARVGEYDHALTELEKMLERGFFCHSVLTTDSWLDPLRGLPRLQAVVEEAQRRQREAEERFARAGGYELLPVQAPARSAGAPSTRLTG